MYSLPAQRPQKNMQLNEKVNNNKGLRIRQNLHENMKVLLVLFLIRIKSLF